MSDAILVRSSMRVWDLSLWLLAGVANFITGWIVFENGEREFGIFLQAGEFPGGNGCD